MPVTFQCRKCAVRSFICNVRRAAPDGTPDQLSGGEMSLPLHVQAVGIVWPSAKACERTAMCPAGALSLPPPPQPARTATPHAISPATQRVTCEMYAARMAGRMVHLGYGKWVRADRIFAVVPLEPGDRGDGRRTYVHVEGLSEPLIASRSERAILGDVEAALSEEAGIPGRRAGGSRQSESLF